MGRRSRKRGAAVPASARPAAAPRGAAPVRRRGADERPRAPWHPFPLVELCVLLGLVMLILGALSFDSDRGRILLVCGLALGSLGGLDTALREHTAGFRSHTTVLSALPGVLAAGVLFFARVPWVVVVAGAVLVFTGAFWAWRRAFVSRAHS